MAPWLRVQASLAAAVFLVACSHPETATPARSGSPSSSSLAPRTVALATGSFPIALAPGFGSLWVVAHNGPWIAPIDPSKDRIGGHTTVGPFPRSIVAGFGSLWVANSGNGTVTRVDARSRRVQATISVLGPSNSTVLAKGAGALWVSDYFDGPGAIRRVDPHTNRATMTLRLGHVSLAFGAGSLWAARYAKGDVLRINPKSGRVIRDLQVAKHAFIGPQSFRAGFLWVTTHSSSPGKLYRIDSGTDRVTKVGSIGAGAGAAAVDSHGVWIADGIDYRLEGIDPKSGRRFVSLHLDGAQNDNGGPEGLALGFGRAWATLFTSAGGVVSIPLSSR